MASTASVVEHALDLLAGVGPVRARAMFGGHGFWAGPTMFALLYQDELYLRTDDLTVERFRAAGCVPFEYEGAGRRITFSYYRPPDDAHESDEAMLPWASLAVEAAARAAAKQRMRPARRAARKLKPSRGRAPGRRRRRAR